MENPKRKVETIVRVLDGKLEAETNWTETATLNDLSLVASQLDIQKMKILNFMNRISKRNVEL